MGQSLSSLHEKFKKRNENEKEEAEDSTKARCEKIVIEGLVRTKFAAVENIFKELFKTKTIDELEDVSKEVKTQLEELGCFKTTNVNLESRKPQTYNVEYILEENPCVTGKLQTSIAKEEGRVTLNTSLPNLTGNADVLSGDLIFNSDKTVKSQINYRRPIPGVLWNPKLDLNFFFQDKKAPNLGFYVNEGGASLGVNFQFFQNVKQHVCWEGAIRQQIGQGLMSIISRGNCGYSMKSSLKHTAIIDDRDSRLFPTQGSLIKFITEVSGLGGSINFVKNHLLVQHTQTLPHEIILQTSFGCGILKNFGGGSLYVDTFSLGGPLSVRGFDVNGIDPHNDSVSSYWVGNLHLYLPFVISPLQNCASDFISNYYTHFFINTGNLGNSNNGLRNLIDLTHGLRISYGVGLVVTMKALGRVELNYCIPCQHERCDKTVTGFQFGIGFDFL